MFARTVTTVLAEASTAIRRSYFPDGRKPNSGVKFSYIRQMLALTVYSAWRSTARRGVQDARLAHQRAMELAPRSTEVLNNFGAYLRKAAEY